MENNFETLRVEKTSASCRLCEDFSEEAVKTRKTAIASCDGACVQGEISRKMVNHLAYNIDPEKYARICLGSAVTKNSGQRNLLRSLENLVVIEGCSLKCGSRLIQAVTPREDMKVELISSYCDWDKKLFGINEISQAEVEKIAAKGAENYFKGNNVSESSSCCG